LDLGGGEEISSPRCKGHLALAKPETNVTSDFDTLQAELKAFAAAIRERRSYPISAEGVLHSVEVFEAIAKLARTGALVALDSV
jgi:predicted dehydrogenase